MAAEPHSLTAPDLDQFLDAEEAPGWAAEAEAHGYPHEEESDPGPAPSPPRERWRIENDDQADWAMRKLGRANRELAEAHLAAENRMDQVRRWLSAASRDPERQRAFFEGLLTDYGQRRRRAEPKTATFPLPSGVIRTRKQGEAVIIVDEELVLKWTREHHPGIVRVVRDVLVSDLRTITQIAKHEDGTKRVVDVNGQAVPGVAVRPEETTITPVPEPTL